MPDNPNPHQPRPVMVSADFMAEATAHIDDLCDALGLDRTKDHNACYRLSETASASPMSDEEVGILVWQHNRWAAAAKEQMYGSTSSASVKRDTQLTHEQVVLVEMWARPIALASSRWDASYTETRLKEIYETLRGREDGGLVFNGAPLTIKQADEVVNLIGHQLGLDRHDLRMETPRTWERTKKGRRVLRRLDEIAPSAMQHGTGHVYCERCGVPVDQGADCPRRKCPIADEL